MSIEIWSNSDWERAREGYRYPPARLIRSESSDQAPIPGLPLAGDANLIQSSDNHALERFHSDLLWSEVPTDRLHGLLSTVYWGFYASADPKRAHNPGRAMARAMHIVHGRKGQDKPSLENVHSALEAARAAVREERLDHALKAIMNIKNMGMSFASKILMFFSPTSAVVYDSIIAEKLQALAEANEYWSPMVVNVQGAYREEKGKAYMAWCRHCTDKAIMLNASDSRWSDANGAKHEWRAVDVERALFALT